MKMIRNWIILVVLLTIISVALFITGRMHKVYVENKTVGSYTALKDVSYSIDKAKAKKLKPNKKGAVDVKGRGHQIEIAFKDENGNTQKVVKKIKLGATEDVLINLPTLVGGGDKWIEEFEGK